MNLILDQPTALNDRLLAAEVYFRSLTVEQAMQAPHRSSATLGSGVPSVTPIITGPRQFRIEVLGAKRYDEVFEAPFGPRTERGVVLDIQVQLRRETNSNAARVLVQEQVAGNLAPRIAEDFRRALVDGDLDEFRHCECSAKIREGITASQNDGHYSMWLDIPQDDD